MSQDRTSEFLSLVSAIHLPSDYSASQSTTQTQQSLKSTGKRQQYTSSTATASHSHQHQHQHQQPSVGRYGVPDLASTNNNPYTELREFHTTAVSISADIATTSTLLAELAQLVRHRSHNLFLAEDDSTRINSLVVTIKTSIESLNLRLDDAQRTIDDKKRRLGKNSQAGQEATNLVDQLRQEFVRATKGFKQVLQQRSDGMKEVEDRKLAVLGPSVNSSGVVGGQGGGTSLALGNRPPVYGASATSLVVRHGAGTCTPSFASTSGGANRSMMPSLDLTSAYSGVPEIATPAGESTSSAVGYSLPRPREFNNEEFMFVVWCCRTGWFVEIAVLTCTYCIIYLFQSLSTSSLNLADGIGAAEISSLSYTSPAMAGLRSRHSSFGQATTTSSTYLSSSTTTINTAYTALTPVEIAQMEEEDGHYQTMQLIPDQSYLQDRANAMNQVESNIVELGTIFNKLAVMVSEHREMVQRIEDNVEDSAGNIELSMAALTDTLSGLSTNRALFMKVFGILVVFIILFITFFA